MSHKVIKSNEEWAYVLKIQFQYVFDDDKMLSRYRQGPDKFWFYLPNLEAVVDTLNELQFRTTLI